MFCCAAATTDDVAADEPSIPASSRSSDPMRPLVKIRQALHDDETHLIDLTRHFFKRFFDFELISSDTEAHLGVVQILALLTVPGVFYTLFIAPNYGYIFWHYSPALYNSVCISDQCRFVLFSMVVMGLVAVLEWDRLFPDGRDYAILIALPLKLQTIFGAKVAALLIFVGLFVLAAAGIPTVFYPTIEAGGLPQHPLFGEFARMVIAHGIAVFSGSLFMFLFFVALQGLLINLLSYSQCRKVSLYVQGLATVALVCQAFLFPLIPDLLPVWEKAHSRFLFFLPPMWFLGLYRALLGSHNALFLSLSRISIVAFVLSLLTASATYFVSYRRYSQMAFEAAEERGPWRFGISILLGRLTDWLVVRPGPERATFYFVLKTLARSARHRLYFVTYLAVGLALVLAEILEPVVYSAHGDLSAAIGRPSPALLWIPLVVSVFALLGMRAAFDFPAELPANWIFRITEENNGRMCMAGARKAMIAVAILPLFAMSFAVYAELWGPVASLLTVLFDVFLALILMELILYSSRKIPFTCSHLPGKVNAMLMAAIGGLVLAFCAYARAALGNEKRTFQEHVVWIAALGAEIIILNRIMVHRKHAFANSPGIEYEDKPLPAVQTLDLNA